MLSADIVQKLTETAASLLASNGMELVDLEVRREGRALVLCLYIDKPGGVTLDDCAMTSREYSSLLDVIDCIPGRYTLEVSSPGLNRPLKKHADYARVVGRLVRVKTSDLWQDEAGNRRKTFLGQLLEAADDHLVILLKEGQTARVPLDIVVKANLEFEF